VSLRKTSSSTNDTDSDPYGSKNNTAGLPRVTPWFTMVYPMPLSAKERI